MTVNMYESYHKEFVVSVCIFFVIIKELSIGLTHTKNIYTYDIIKTRAVSLCRGGASSSIPAKTPITVRAGLINTKITVL